MAAGIAEGAVRRKKSSQPRQLKRTRTKKSATSGFDAYQRRACETIHGKADGQRRHIASMLGLASETGSILDSYKRYLRDSIDLSANRKFLREELGDLLWYIAAVATACSLELSDIAEDNLHRARQRYGRIATKRKPMPAHRGEKRPICWGIDHRRIRDDFADYQRCASETSRLKLRGPDGAIAPMLGLAGATGSILGLSKDKPWDIDLRTHKPFFLKKLGDLLWYTSAVATASDLDLGEIAERNLVRAHDLYTVPIMPIAKLFGTIPTFDKPSRPAECFPRAMIIAFDEHDEGTGLPVVTQRVVEARPYAFPNGASGRGRKRIGFNLGVRLGGRVTDNSQRRDGYRYHDAIHWSFAAVLGWSPTIRKLLGVRRISNPNTNRDEDGARAQFTEEGLSAILSKLAPRRMGFLGENTVDGEVIMMAKAAVQDVEAQSLPGWLWRSAISQGFNAMRELKENKGGYLKVDLDNRKLTYSKMKPELGRPRK